MRPAKRRFAPNPVVPKLCLGMRPREALLRNLNPRRNLGIILKRKLPRRSGITSPTGTLHPRESREMENRKQINCHRGISRRASGGKYPRPSAARRP